MSARTAFTGPIVSAKSTASSSVPSLPTGIRESCLSIDTPENKKFVEAFKAYCKKNNLPGGDTRVTDDPIEAAYYGVYVWKMAAEKAGSFDVDAVRAAVYGMEFDAPGGKKKMHPTNQHTFKPVYIGEILKDGQFKIVWKSEGLVEPDSYSKLLWDGKTAPAPTGGDPPAVSTHPMARPPSFTS